MSKPYLKMLWVVILIGALHLAAAALEEKKQTFKIDADKKISLIVKMTPAAGKLIIKTGSKRGEVQLHYPADSQISLHQNANTITIEGQHQPSTYTLLVPQKNTSVALDINGKPYNLSHENSKNGVYEIDIR
ncbi:MAG: hypothetical protein HY231_21300 [Acidobacteria bacterium]|nr:hypothetical protein [Acidobacteriota bacterium]